jgi:hypothetical protein
MLLGNIRQQLADEGRPLSGLELECRSALEPGYNSHHFRSGGGRFDWPPFPEVKIGTATDLRQHALSILQRR